MEEALRVQFERFDHAINHMSNGLCVFGPDERLIVCNARYIDIYGLDPAIVKPGITHRELLTQDLRDLRLRHETRFGEQSAQPTAVGFLLREDLLELLAGDDLRLDEELSEADARRGHRRGV